MNKAYKVSHILDDVLEAYDDSNGIDPDMYYTILDGEISEGPFDSEYDASENAEDDYDEIVMGSDLGDEESEDEDEDEEIEEGRGRPKGVKNGGGKCGKDTHLRWSKAQGKCYAPISGSGRGRQSSHGCKPGQRWSAKSGCYDKGTVARGRPTATGVGGVGGAADKKAYKAKKARTPRAATMESLSSSIIRKINSF